MALFRVSNERAQFDAAGNDARDQYGAGIRFTQGGNARVTTGSATNYNQGIPMSATGQVAIVDATAGLPVDTIYHNGLPMSGDKVCVSRNATAVVSNGLPFDSAGAVAADINLDLNFVGATSMNSSVTFTRASSATFTGSNGLIQSATTNTPRFDYDPVTLAAKGLLIEEQRTNLFTYSEDLTNAAWSQTASAATISGNVAVAPDGTTTADKIVSTVATSYGTRTPVFTSTAAAYTQTAFCKADGFNYVKFVWSSTQNATEYAVFNLTNGTVTGGTYTSASITPFGNGWYRCSITSTLAAVSTYSNIWMSDGTLSRTAGVAGDGTSGILVWGAQVELGAFATSYIPTVASQVTRSADVASVNTLSPWYNETEGTLYAEWSQYAIPVVTTRVATIDSGTAANILQAQSAGVNRTGALSVASVGVFAYATSPITVNAVNKIGIATKSGDSSVAVGGVTLGTSTATYTPPAMTTLRIGSNIAAGQPVNGHIRRITYYPRRLSNAELQAITA